VPYLSGSLPHCLPVIYPSSLSRASIHLPTPSASPICSLVSLQFSVAVPSSVIAPSASVLCCSPPLAWSPSLGFPSHSGPFRAQTSFALRPPLCLVGPSSLGPPSLGPPSLRRRTPIARTPHVVRTPSRRSHPSFRGHNRRTPSLGTPLRGPPSLRPHCSVLLRSRAPPLRIGPRRLDPSARTHLPGPLGCVCFCVLPSPESRVCGECCPAVVFAFCVRCCSISSCCELVFIHATVIYPLFYSIFTNNLRHIELVSVSELVTGLVSTVTRQLLAKC
jgi:hypothetical protein